MKKYILSCIVVLLSTATVSFAQLAIGAKAGVNIATIDDYAFFTDVNGEPIDDLPLVGLTIGAVAEIGLTKFFYLQPEVSFIQRGISWKDDENQGTDIKTTDRYNYLDIAALAKFKYRGEKIGGYLVAGPQLGYLLSGKMTAEGTIIGQEIDSSSDIDVSMEVFNRWEFSVAVGGGLVLPLSAQLEPFIDVRYVQGFTDFWNPGFVGALDARNRGVSMTVGALLSFKDKE
ncbi:MAG: porin family protein [Bacteroidota bacterium]